MREIKFRVWDRGNKAFRYVVFDNDGWDFGDSKFIQHDTEFSQYTGLKDKNGREIYEGDIVEMVVDHYGLKLMGEVIFSYGEFIVRFNHYSPIGFWHLGRQKSVIVKGNTFENPELLNKYESSFI